MSPSPLPARGEVWCCELPDVGGRPVVVFSRDEAIPRVKGTLVVLYYHGSRSGRLLPVIQRRAQEDQLRLALGQIPLVGRRRSQERMVAVALGCAASTHRRTRFRLVALAHIRKRSGPRLHPIASRTASAPS